MTGGNSVEAVWGSGGQQLSQFYSVRVTCSEGGAELGCMNDDFIMMWWWQRIQAKLYWRLKNGLDWKKKDTKEYNPSQYQAVISHSFYTGDF